MNQPLSLIDVTDKPYNAETPLSALLEDVTPTNLVYVRNHFEVPQVDASKWNLKIGGAVREPRTISLEDLRSLPAKEVLVTLECAGNGRLSMDPTPKGTPWGQGAVSVVRFSGTPVSGVLKEAGIDESAVEILFVGADQGEVKPGRTEKFARSLPLEVGLEPDTLLIWEMNGATLPLHHGFPLRLLVPGWYGMASVKWLKEIVVLTEPFQGFFQSEHYVYLEEGGILEGEPVRFIRPRSLILHPADGTAVESGEILITGIAWSGHGPITAVNVNVNGDDEWHVAELSPQSTTYGIQRWSYIWTPNSSGTFKVRSRATDSGGNVQPKTHRWNRLGYGNNGPHAITVQIV